MTQQMAVAFFNRPLDVTPGLSGAVFTDEQSGYGLTLETKGFLNDSTSVYKMYCLFHFQRIDTRRGYSFIGKKLRDAA